MKTQIKLATLLPLLSINFQLSTFAQGSLTPPGAPAPAMKTLAQIEPRTPISAVPFTISTPGSYYLTTNLTTAVSNAIVITANNVTLDLNGFTISSAVANAASGGTAILLGSGLSDITIGNGHIVGGVTNNGAGVFSGSGFNFGIYYSGGVPRNVLVSRVTVSGCLNSGIYLTVGNAAAVEFCAVRTVGNLGIYASVIKSSVASDCGSYGIYGDTVSDCRGEITGVSGYGVYATTANNCIGRTSGGGYGVFAIVTASGCNGYSNTGTGLSAFIANVCHGATTSGTALSVAHNVNSF